MIDITGKQICKDHQYLPIAVWGCFKGGLFSEALNETKMHHNIQYTQKICKLMNNKQYKFLRALELEKAIKLDFNF